MSYMWHGKLIRDGYDSFTGATATNVRADRPVVVSEVRFLYVRVLPIYLIIVSEVSPLHAHLSHNKHTNRSAKIVSEVRTPHVCLLPTCQYVNLWSPLITCTFQHTCLTTNVRANIPVIVSEVLFPHVRVVPTFTCQYTLLWGPLITCTWAYLCLIYCFMCVAVLHLCIHCAYTQVCSPNVACFNTSLSASLYSVICISVAHFVYTHVFLANRSAPLPDSIVHIHAYSFMRMDVLYFVYSTGRRP